MRRRRFGIISISIILAVLFVVIAVVGVGAQSEGKKQAAQTQQEILKADSTGTRTGWLILDGAYIPGPYEVVITDSTILVNGAEVVKPPEPGEKRNVDPQSTARHEIGNSIQDTFRFWLAETMVETAQEKTLEFINGQEMIERAHFIDDYTVRVCWKGRPGGERISLEPPQGPEMSREERLQDNLQLYGGRLKMHLTSGSLVVMHQDRYRAILYPRAKSVFNDVSRIVTTESDRNKRVEKLQKIFHRRQISEAIADKFEKQ